MADWMVTAWEEKTGGGGGRHGGADGDGKQISGAKGVLPVLMSAALLRGIGRRQTTVGCLHPPVWDSQLAWDLQLVWDSHVGE